MVIQYLEKIQRGFGERLLELKKEEEMIQKSLNENQRFIELLEESTDTNIAAFSPRKNNPNARKRFFLIAPIFNAKGTISLTVWKPNIAANI